ADPQVEKIMTASAHETLIGSNRATGSKVQLLIEGMSCASCVARIEKALRALPGVIGATANLATARASVRYAAGSVDIAALERAVAAIGYEAKGIVSTDTEVPEQDHRETELRLLGRAVVQASIFTLPVFVLEMGSHAIPAFHHWVMTALGDWNW